MSSLWMVTASIEKGSDLRIIGFFDKKRKESRDDALTRLVHKDPNTRLEILAQIAGTLCGISYKTFMASIKKDIKKVTGNQNEIENRIIDLMKIRSFKLSISSVDNEVRSCIMTISKNK